MLQQRQYFRKILETKGFVFLAGRELKILVRNLSVKGLLAEVDEGGIVNELEQIFAAIKQSTRIDFYLPELRMAGDAELIRVDLIGDVFLLALEFKDFSHEVNNSFYQRKAYRKQMMELGKIHSNGENFPFITRNVSQDGVMLQILEKTSFEEGMITDIVLQKLAIEGEGKVIWVHKRDEETLLGVQFLDIDKSLLDSIPRFFR